MTATTQTPPPQTAETKKKEAGRWVHKTTGRDGTACGRGGRNPAWTSRNPDEVTCPRCRRVMAKVSR